MDKPLIFKDMNLSDKRGEDESYEDYKIRRANNNKLIKSYLKHGYVAWMGGMGTYIISRDGEL